MSYEDKEEWYSRIPTGSSVTCRGDIDCVSSALCEVTTCKTRVGETCPYSGSTQCAAGTQCVEASTGSNTFQCRIPAGSNVNCRDDNDCVSTAACYSTTCKTKVGQACPDSSFTHCMTGSQCVETSTGNNTFQCRIPAGDAVNCSDSDKCVTTAVCESNARETKVGEMCSTSNSTYCKNGTECADTGNSNFQCRIPAGSAVSCGGDSDKCVTTAVCESNTCKTKVGETCSNSNPDHCQTGAECVNTGSNNYHCRLSVGQTCTNRTQCVPDTECEDIGVSGKQCRKKYGIQCNADSECQTSQRQTCVNITSGSSLCLCDDQSFRHSDQCENVTQLTATQLKMSGTHQETSISVTWTRPQISAEYRATLNTGQTSNYGDISMFTFTDLTQGTAFTFSITSRKERNPNHTTTAPEYATVVSWAVPVYTRPAQPGPLLSDRLPGPNVTLTFTASMGHVDSYSVTATPQKPLHTAVTVNSSMNSVVIPGLVAGEYYNVSITAISNNIDSAVRTDTFRVKSQSVGQVFNLTQKAQGIRWTELKWNRPVNPSGVISGYTVRVVLESDQQSCISGVAVNCSDCVYNSTEVIPDTSTCTHSMVKTLTKAELNDESFVVEVNVTQLKPYVQYQVEVMAYNEEGSGHPDSLTFLTDSEAADNLVAMEVSAPAIGQLLVSWRPGEERGETNYTVTWEEQDSLLSQSYTQHGSHLLQGYDARYYTIQGLLSYWNYRVTVTTITTVGPAPVPSTVTNRTLESKPGQVQNLSLTQSDDDATKITMTIICPTERERNGHLVEFRYNSTVTDTEAGGVPQRPEGSVKVSGNCGTLTKVLPVTAQTSYNVSVYAVTESGLKGEDSASTITIQARPPTVINKPTSDLMSEEMKTETSVTVTVQRDQIFSDEQGRLEIAGMLVCQKRGPQSCQRGPDKTSDDFKNPSKTPTWGRNRKSQDSVYYRATPDNFQDLYSGGRSRRSVGSALGRERRDTGSFQFIIGSDTSCPELSDDVYCNGPLEPGQQYLVVVFSCTKGGCSETTEPSEVTTKEKEDSQPIGGIVGGVVAVVAVIVIVVVVVVVIRRRRSRSCGTPGSNNKRVPRQNKRALPPTREASTDIRLEDTLHNQKCISMLLFSARIEALHRNSDLHFLREYQELLAERGRQQYNTHIGRLPTNSVKNRNPDVLPYDHTRVKLFDREADGQDYINASYITGSRSPCDYVATQTPLISTVPDFWKMVWEQNSSLIVMLSHQEQHSQAVTEVYWPSTLNCPVHYGDVVVTLLSTTDLPVYTRRQFTLRRKEQEEREVLHYQLPHWQAVRTDCPLTNVCDVVSSLTQRTAASAAPVIVHCSEGTARTCTYIALDTLQRHVTEHAPGEDIDVFTTLLNITRCRPAMLQSERQYMFIHDVVRVMVDRKMREGQHRGTVYENEAAFRNSSVYDTTYVYGYQFLPAFSTELQFSPSTPFWVLLLSI
ncbi:phosphatidylinositol phosphatase PTPRQ-like [Babylonia areolata]|uniref:phosphatidylinositol phosphatase PTPRQ-like n=1 Tax=Babylonia areolata TaxID=304850 RepID=UPI003FD0FA42